MSDRIILIRIQGLGSLLAQEQMVFTSRGTLPYLNANGATLAGVVSNLGDQFSSEIGFFEEAQVDQLARRRPHHQLLGDLHGGDP